MITKKFYFFYIFILTTDIITILINVAFHHFDWSFWFLLSCTIIYFLWLTNYLNGVKVTEYNLTWDEAEEAMNRGAVMQSEKSSHGALIKGFNRSPDGMHTAFLKNHNCSDWLPSVVNIDYADLTKWRIVELMDCEIVANVHEMAVNCYACIVHAPLYVVKGSSGSLQDIKTSLKNNCIQKFTEQLKKDMKHKFLKPIPYYPSIVVDTLGARRVKNKAYKVSDFEYGKFYKSIDNKDLSAIKLNYLPSNYAFFVNKKWVTPEKFEEIVPGLTRRIIEEATYIEVTEEDLMQSDKKEKSVKITKLEEGKFYTWGNKTTIFKIKNGVIWSFEKISHNPMWHKRTPDFMEYYTESHLLSVFDLQETLNPETKKYSFEKALSGMRHGKFYQDIETKIIYRLSDKFYFQLWVGEWRLSLSEGLPKFMLKKFIEVENPEKKEPEVEYNGLSLSNIGKEGDMPVFNMDHEDYKGKVFIDSDGKKKKLTKAFTTFLRLKSHPLAVKLVHDGFQCFIAFDSFYKNTFVNQFSHINAKSSELSPAFNSKENAERAIKDIGEDNLVEMFKAFSGIYE